MPGSGDAKLVCVTGAGGYLGSRVVGLLIERGYRVRAAVRDASDASRTERLTRMGRVELASVDIMDARSLALAVEGCDLLVHMASSVRLSARDPQRQIVDVAVQGTRNALAAAAGRVERVVLTSSVAAIVDHTRVDGHVFTEDDWNEHSTLEVDPYPLSKTLAEREAWRLHEEHGGAYELTAIHPGMVFGPVLDARHLRSSPALLHQLVTGRMKGCPRLAFPVVDVRDVAEAHVRALEAERPSRRYLCVASTRWYADLARMIRSALPDVPVATRQLPDWIILAASLFDRRIGFTYMRNNLGKFPRFSNERIRSELGLAFRPIEETIADAARSIVDGGWS